MICRLDSPHTGFRIYMSSHLIDVVEQLGQPRILVLGDLILDRYVWGDADRISQEAPVITLQEDRQETRLGGAANVANMLVGLDSRVTLAGVVGTDTDGDRLRRMLKVRGVDATAVLRDQSRPTTVKERFIGRTQQRHSHQILRVDRESCRQLDSVMTHRLLEFVESKISEHQAVLISDYGKGVVTPEVLAHVIQAARNAGIPVIVDPCSGAEYSNYAQVTAVTPNRMETKKATGLEIHTVDDAFIAGRMLCQRLQLQYVFITLDSDGIAVIMADGSADLVPTRKRDVYDITGAGDMVLAMVGVGAAEGLPPIQLASLANVAGGLEVEQVGVVTVSRRQIITDLLGSSRNIGEKRRDIDDLACHTNARRKLGQKIVLTNGCFDCLHVGHVTYLQEAARQGDCLIVAVNSDASIRQLNKGPDRPIFNQDQRTTMLAALEAVDYVTVFDEPTPHAVIERLKPDLLVKGGTYTAEQIVGRELVESYGGAFKALGVVPGISTTEILNRFRGQATITNVDDKTDRRAA